MRENGSVPIGRRAVIGRAAIGLLIGSSVLLIGCGQEDGSEPTEIHWDRDTCEYCRMVISERAFAAQMFSPADQTYRKFDDVGCLVNWLAENQSSSDRSSNRLWVADHRHIDRAAWLNARLAAYLSGRRTPMDYGYGALPDPVPASDDFEGAQKNMLERKRQRSGS